MVINFDFRREAKKSGHLDYPLQSYGPKVITPPKKEAGSDSLLEVTPGPQDPILCVINLSQKLDNGQNDKNMSTAQYLSRIRNTKSNLTLA